MSSGRRRIFSYRPLDRFYILPEELAALEVLELRAKIGRPQPSLQELATAIGSADKPVGLQRVVLALQGLKSKGFISLTIKWTRGGVPAGYSADILTPAIRDGATQQVRRALRTTARRKPTGRERYENALKKLARLKAEAAEIAVGQHAKDDQTDEDAKS